ncbi:MAG: (2E,6E)-farnesyl diphosphate synthase [Candidatus Pelagadaptatus aseana]|uniref:(2E,6E)-farnesyl diphosphate synthase n=1 Tax=Candidatus Pelagadaptatus aseana TaxID=3120508 RepID=UPI0039B31FF8
MPADHSSPSTPQGNAFLHFFSEHQARIEQALNSSLEQRPHQQLNLHQAIRYSLLSGGKRVRPVLAYAAAAAITSTTNELIDRAACAVECIHAYSLIHDDLPAMDDDDLRRGQPTCHKQFDEATAILAGDALQTLAFELIADCDSGDDASKLQLISTLARASGDKGMVAGQAIDIAAVDSELQLDQLEQMHNHKTGALISASVRMGALATGCATEQQLHALEQYAAAVGLAFQVQDDILDVIADTETLGKQQGADQALNKPTYVSLLGLEGARQKAEALHQQALQALKPFDHSADPLRGLSAYIVERSH